MRINRLVIGFSGKKGAGKTVCAEYVKNKYKSTDYTFAETLKRGVQVLFGFTDKQIFVDKDTIDKRYNKSPRYFMQLIGTDVIRNNCGRDHWVNIVANKIKKDNHQFITISDVRFQNEHNYVYNFKRGYIIKIVNDNLKNMDKHSSEEVIEKCDFVIDNTNITLEELYKKIDNIIKSIL